MRTIFVGPAHPQRRAVENLARSVYLAQHHAVLSAFPDVMVAAVDPQGVPLCVAGLRTAESGFFSETYLDWPVENAISQATGSPVRRDSVLEVSTLASLRPGCTFKLVDHIFRFAHQTGTEWGLFTATRRLRLLLRRGGLGLTELTAARPDRITDPSVWGRYYDADPVVCAIEVANSAPAESAPPRSVVEDRIEAFVA